MDIALIGPPGAGKGTQAYLIADKFNLTHMSSGNLFRENLQKQTALGILARRYIRQGELVPDDIADAMMEERVRQVDPTRGIVLDGFPFTEYQAHALDEFLVDTRGHLEAVIYLRVLDEESIYRRISERLTCRRCQRPYHETLFPPKQVGICDDCQGELYRRTDDDSELIQVRIKNFYRQVEPVMTHYQKMGKLIVLDGERSIKEVNDSLNVVLTSLQRIAYHRATIGEIQRIQVQRQAPRPLSVEQVAHRSLNLVLLGAPGAGKGTQAHQLSDRMSLTHIATGNLFRENMQQETELGLIAKGFIERGELVPDHITEAMVQDRLSQPDTHNGFILDGFPRTVSQAQALTEMMTSSNRRISGVLYINVSDELVIDRLTARWICRSCQKPYHLKFNPPQKKGICDDCGSELYQREDDNPETVRARLRMFHQQTAPLIDYYAEGKLLIEINGEGQIDMVVEKMIEAACNLEEATC